MTKIADYANSSLLFSGASAPATPAAGTSRLYFKTDGKPYYKNDGGTEVALGSGSSSGRNVVTALTASSGVVTVNCSLGDYFTLTPTAAVTGWTFTNVPAGCTITIKLLQGSTAYAVAMPTAKWAGGNAGAFSTTANARDRLAMTTDDSGATWDATLGKAFA